MGIILIVVVCLVSQGIFHESSIWTHLTLAAAIALVVFAGIAVHCHALNRTLIEPISRLKKETDELVNRLDSQEVFLSSVHTGDEIEALAHSIEEMDRSLKRYIRENTAITAERERLNTELALAGRIQRDMLPCSFPPFPDRTEFDLFASMDPAKEVGGDFYDFFLIDRTHLGLVIADVSGKCIPAALFMMMSKLLIQNVALTGRGPAEVLRVVNEQICANNREEMFVTVWFGVLDTETGTVTAASAGHEYPAVQSGGSFALLKDKHGFVIGGMEDVRYREYAFTLEAGAKLFLYTDGVPEATSAERELFGTDRMLSALNSDPGAEPEQVLKNVRRAVDGFVNEAEQFDDLTMLCLAYKGNE